MVALTRDLVLIPGTEQRPGDRILAGNSARFDPDPLYAEVAEGVTGRPMEWERSDGASDARFFSEYRIPAIMSRPLVGDLHGEAEWIDIASMQQFYDIYIQYIGRKLGLPMALG
jgi:acetylornithine deacetylase/succinyl-diaminopimelate desuccinylase-like protein